MRKKKLLVGMSVVICIILIAVGVVFIADGTDNLNNSPISLKEVKENFQKDIQSLKDGRYDNLIYHDFKASIEDVEGVYNIEIQTDKSYLDNTYLENFANMNAVIDKFFVEDFDKSYIIADFHMPDGETVEVGYHDIEKVCADEKYNTDRTEFLFGNEISNGGYMVQIAENLHHTWFSRGAFGEIQPSEYKKVYPYVTCIRQIDDVEVKLMDKTVKLSEMEEKVLSYLNQEFPLPTNEAIDFGIGDVRILDNGEYDGICFKVRRIYKGVPFEYGSNVSSGMYIDELDNDGGELDYAVSAYPDTMLAFGLVNGTVVENKEISEMISLGTALQILSEKIGENSIYDVYGVELIYRNCAITEEHKDELDDILSPKWKIITVNQNDDKYTLFYVDVVTGEVTERFEYYYD